MRFLVFAILFAAILHAADPVELYGRIAVKGSEPFTYLALETKKESYKIVGKKREQLYTKQGTWVYIKAKILTAGTKFQPPEIKVEAISDGPFKK